MDKKNQINIFYALLAFFLIFLFQSWYATQRQVEPISYSKFEDLLRQGEIEQVSVKEKHLEGKLRNPLPDGRQYFVTVRVEQDMAEQLSKYGVNFTGTIQNTWLRDILSWILPVLFFLGVWMFLIRKMAEKQGFGGMTTIGKSKAKVYVETDTKVTFEDVAGVDEAKAELQEVVNFLNDPDSYGRLGARIPKGVLLVGPPGTGKTLLARAVAGEAGVPFYSISGAEFVEMFVGVGAARVRDLFEQARKAAPSIIFIDELDALGRARGFSPMGGYDEKEQTLNQLLNELDGFDTSQGIVLLAATNRPEILDPALLRAGRFDRQVLVDRPDKLGRSAILKVHLRKIVLADDVDPDQIAALTPGFSGADLANLINEAALAATRRNSNSVTMEDFNVAIERIVAGLEKKSRVLNPRERKTVAYHEMGHALIAASLPGMDPIHKVSIIPRGIGALGYTMQRPTEDRFLMTRRELKDKMTVLLGGRAAEAMVFGEISTGANDDLDKATEIARNMVTRFGMSEEAGQMVYEPQRQAFLGDSIYGVSQQREYSEASAKLIDNEIRILVDRALTDATEILEKRRADLDEGAALLLENEVLTADEFPPIQSNMPGQSTSAPTPHPLDSGQGGHSQDA
jgi:cell division protease FtsH